jgi:hypothetical protein
MLLLEQKMRMLLSSLYPCQVFPSTQLSNLAYAVRTIFLNKLVLTPEQALDSNSAASSGELNQKEIKEASIPEPVSLNVTRT